MWPQTIDLIQITFKYHLKKTLIKQFETSNIFSRSPQSTPSLNPKRKNRKVQTTIVHILFVVTIKFFIYAFVLFYYPELIDQK